MCFFQEYHPNLIVDFGNRLQSKEHVQGIGIQAALFMSEPGNEFVRALLEDYKGDILY